MTQTFATSMESPFGMRTDCETRLISFSHRLKYFSLSHPILLSRDQLGLGVPVLALGQRAVHVERGRWALDLMQYEH